MKADLVEAIGKLAIGAILAIGMIFLGNKLIDQLIPILETQTEVLKAQTEALKRIADIYSGDN